MPAIWTPKPHKPSSPRGAPQAIIHPPFFVIFPVLFLFATNVQNLDWRVIIAPGLATALFGLMFWFLLRSFITDRRLAAGILSLTFVAIFSFGSFNEFVFSGAPDISLLFLVSLLMFSTVSFIIIALRRFLSVFTYVMNVIGVLLVLISLQKIVVELYTVNAANRLVQPTKEEFHAHPDEIAEELPDIYYFVFDGYGRDDILRAQYGYDNSRFLSLLNDKGFYVATESTANYTFTVSSITGTLNFCYLQDLLGEEMRGLADWTFVREVLTHNRLTRFLSSYGYKIVVVESISDMVKLGNVDRRFDKPWFPKTFTSGLMEMTPAPALLRSLGWAVLHDLHRARIEYQFGVFDEIPAIPGPKFVFAHIWVAHPPFVFGPNGEPRAPSRMYSVEDGRAYFSLPGASKEEYIVSYRDQVNYLNTKIVETVDSILRFSEGPPVMILQGDHGPRSEMDFMKPEDSDLKEALSILSAYYFPEKEYGNLYDSITPVNSFRVVLNRYFGTNLPLLKDKNYFVPAFQPYQFVPVAPAELAGLDDSKR